MDDPVGSLARTQIEACLQLVVAATKAIPIVRREDVRDQRPHLPFLAYTPGDAPYVTAYQIGFEICSDGSGKYDVWSTPRLGGDRDPRLIRTDLDLEQATIVLCRALAQRRSA
jgi:hypothetical protein